jgi:hypothetical protein
MDVLCGCCERWLSSTLIPLSGVGTIFFSSCCDKDSCVSVCVSCACRVRVSVKGGYIINFFFHSNVIWCIQEFIYL